MYRRQIGRRFSLLCSQRKFVCVFVCVGYVVVVFLSYLFIYFPTDTGSVKINNASVPPEVLNSVVQKEERKNTTPLPK